MVDYITDGKEEKPFLGQEFLTQVVAEGHLWTTQDENRDREQLKGQASCCAFLPRHFAAVPPDWQWCAGSWTSVPHKCGRLSDAVTYAQHLTWLHSTILQYCYRHTERYYSYMVTQINLYYILPT